MNNTQFSSSDSASRVTTRLLQEKLSVEKKFMSLGLYQSVRDKDADMFVEQLEKIISEMGLRLFDILDHAVTLAGDSLLHLAAGSGADDVAELICNHSTELLLMNRDSKGDTALHVAASKENSNVIKFILSKCAEEKEKSLGEGNAKNSVALSLNNSGKSPLYVAVEASMCTEVIGLLLEASSVSNLELPSHHGISPLHAALSKRDLALLIHILEKKVEVMYLRDEDGGTPLHYAASKGYVEGVCELLRRSTQLALEWDKDGHLPIHLACKMGHVGLVDEFLKLEWPNVRDMLTREGQNILHIAAKNGQNKMVNHLLSDKNRLDEFVINEKDKGGNTALHLASKRPFRPTLGLLSKDDRVRFGIRNNDDLTAFDIVWFNMSIIPSTTQV